MMRIRTCLLTVFTVCASLSSVAAASVEQVAVHLSSVQDAIPPLVQRRIAASIQTVGNHVFLNQDSEDIAGRSEEYERIVNDIINRVLIGYTVESIAINPGSRTDLNVRIRPWGDTIRKVNLTVDYGALPEMGRQMVDKDLSGAGDMVENLLIGLPVDALDWANGAVKSVMETELETRVPEFYPHIVIRGGTETDVTVYMMPKLPVVRNVRAVIKGEDVPKVIFLSARNNLEHTFAGLEGLPVAFVRRHEPDVMAELSSDVKRQWVIKHYGLQVTPTLSVDENTTINVTPKTDFMTSAAVPISMWGAGTVMTMIPFSWPIWAGKSAVIMKCTARSNLCLRTLSGMLFPGTSTVLRPVPRRAISLKASTTAITCGSGSPLAAVGPCGMTAI